VHLVATSPRAQIRCRANNENNYAREPMLRVNPWNYLGLDWESGSIEWSERLEGRGNRERAPNFPPLGNKIDLRLVETKTFGSGVVYLRYERAQQTQ
jgi:hypothetical protein